MRDGRWFGVSKDLATTLARAEKFSHEDATTWRAMLEKFGADAPHIFSLLGSPMTARALAKTGLEGVAREGRGLDARDGAAARSPRRASFSSGISSRRKSARRWPRGACISIFRPTSPAARSSPISKAWPTRAFGMVIGAGGADTMIKAMVARLEALGGVVHLNAEVVEVRREGGRAVGIRLASGETVGAKRAVIAGVDAARARATQLLRRRQRRCALRSRRRKFRYGPGTMMVHLAHVRPARLVGGRGAEALRLRASRARPRHDGARLFGGDGGPAAGRAGARRRPADGDRSVARAGGKAHSLGPGARAAGEDPRRCRGQDRGARLGRGEGGLRRPRRSTSSSATRRARRRRCWRAMSSRPPISSGAIRTSSAATSSAAAIICRRIFCSARCPAGRASERR